MSDTKSTSSGGVGFGGLLTIAFIVLKLCKVIDWSWWWVLSLIWIVAALFVLGYAIIGSFYMIKYLRHRADEKKRLASGMNTWEWGRYKRNKKLGNKPDSIDIPKKSTWQEIKEEMENKRHG